MSVLRGTLLFGLISLVVGGFVGYALGSVVGCVA